MFFPLHLNWTRLAVYCLTLTSTVFAHETHHTRHGFFRRRDVSPSKSIPRFNLRVVSRGKYYGYYLVAYSTSSYVSIQNTPATVYAFNTNCERHISDNVGNVVWFNPPVSWGSQIVPLHHNINPPPSYRSLNAVFDASYYWTDGQNMNYQLQVCTGGHIYISQGLISNKDCTPITVIAAPIPISSSSTTSKSSTSTTISTPSPSQTNDIIDGNFEDPDIYPWTVAIYGNATGEVTNTKSHSGDGSFEVTIPGYVDQSTPRRRSIEDNPFYGPHPQLEKRKGIATGTDRLTLTQKSKRSGKRKRQTSTQPQLYYMSFWYFIQDISSVCSISMYHDEAETQDVTINASADNIGEWKQASALFDTYSDDVFIRFYFECLAPVPTNPQKFYLDDVSGYVTTRTASPTSTVSSSVTSVVTVTVPGDTTTSTVTVTGPRSSTTTTMTVPSSSSAPPVVVTVTVRSVTTTVTRYSGTASTTTTMMKA